jgi:hypothetical protein
MPAKTRAVPPEIYQIKVTLLGTSPPIWRRLLVPADVTLAQLHDVLQTAMGWDDGHMHECSIGQRRIGRPDRCASPAYWEGSAPEDRLMGMPSVENERTPRLSTRMILETDGSMASFWRSGFQLNRTSRIQSAPMVSSRVHRKIVEAFPVSTTS